MIINGINTKVVEVSIEIVDSNIMLYSEKLKKIITLNETGSFIWNEITNLSPNQEITTDNISRKLLKICNLNHDKFFVVLNDTQEIIDKLFKESIFENQ